jgi:predicted RNA-binding protein YlqC (UPF0109 family)
VRDLVEFLCRELVDDPEAVEISESHDERGLLLRVRVADGELGKVIGRGGRTAKAIRTLVRAAAVRRGTHAAVDFDD